MTMTLLEALRDPNLFEPLFHDPSWRKWKTFLAAFNAEAPSDDDLEVYQTYTGRTTWPAKPFREAVVIVGRRGGKSRRHFGPTMKVVQTPILRLSERYGLVWRVYPDPG
jgi:hypothetical protein